MSTYSPRLKPNLSGQSNEILQSRKLEKSKTFNQMLKVTNNYPYVEDLDHKATDKKRRDVSPIQYQPSLLLEQNKALLAQNRQMALLVYHKHQTIESLQAKAQHQSKQETQLLHKIELDKQRFINQVLQNKGETDQHIIQLNLVISQLQDENHSIVQQLNMRMTKGQLQSQKNMKSELQNLKEGHRKNMALFELQKHKMKDDFQKKHYEKQIIMMQMKQKIEMLTHQCSSLREQAKHDQQLKKLQLQENKNVYETKIQNIHLDNRRVKEIFFIQYETQNKKQNQEISRHKLRIQELLSQLQTLKLQIQQATYIKTEIQTKKQLQVDYQGNLLKQQYSKEKEKQYNLFKSELNCIQESLQSQIKQLSGENDRLIKIIQLKNHENLRMFSQIERMRLNHSQQILQNQKLFKDLQAKLLSNISGGEQESQALKVKLTHLREADLSALKNWYQNHITLLNENLFEKEVVIGSNRQKYHEQLKQKAELRKHFQIEILKYKNTILDQQSTIKTLSNNIKLQGSDLELHKTNEISIKSEEFQSKIKVQVLKFDESKQLHEIINAKDKEIQQLQSKIQLLKGNHEKEIDLYLSELKEQQQKLIILRQQNSKQISYYGNETKKYKEWLQLQKQNNQQMIQRMNVTKRQQLDALIEDANKEKEELRHTNSQLKNINKQLIYDIQTLNIQLQQSTSTLKKIQQQNQHLLAHHQYNQHLQSIESYYTEQLASKEAEIVDLKERLTELGNDLRDSKENYNNLQKKMQQLIQTQSELREIQRKVMHLGLSNSYIRTSKQISK